MSPGAEWAARVAGSVGRAIIGQDAIVERLLVALLVGGHVLMEGLPGLGKTLLVKSLAAALALDFERIQFTPDLLPSDVVGTMIFQPASGSFVPHLGPVFAHLVLADEINRAPAKVQSALLEAMQERQVTLGGATHALPAPFLVMATQNPIEQEGTYPLPEAQTDRFLFRLLLDYPTLAEEQAMLDRWGATLAAPELEPVSGAAELMDLRAAVDRVHVAPAIRDYVLALVRHSRTLAGPGLPLLFGASPRASLALLQASRGLALVRGRDHVAPDLVQALAPDVLRHRIAPGYAALADGRGADAIIADMVREVAVPG